MQSSCRTKLDVDGVISVKYADTNLKAVCFDCGDLARDDGAEYLVARLDVCGDGRLILIDGFVIIQKCCGGDDGVGEVALVKSEFTEGAEHTRAFDAAKRALCDFLAAGENGVIKRGGNDVTDMNVPCARYYLHGLRLADVELTYPHMVGVGMLFHGEHLARDDVFYLRTEIFKGLDLGARERHSLGKFLVAYIYFNKLIEPFSA